MFRFLIPQAFVAAVAMLVPSIGPNVDAQAVETSEPLGSSAVETEAPPAVMTNDEAELHDAKISAERFGVSVAEALERSRLREELDPVLATLEGKFRADFAYVEIDHGPEYQFEIHLVADGGSAASYLDVEVVAESALPIVVRTESPFSSAQLEAEIIQVHDAFASQGYQSIASSVDPETGQIEVVLGNQSEAVAQEVVDAMARLIPTGIDPERVEVKLLDGPAGADTANVYGGAKLSTTSTGGGTTCTAGFTVVSGSTRGLATAGHCADSRWYNVMGSPTTYQMTYKNQHIGSWGDFQWHTTTQTEVDDFYSDYGLLRDVSGVRSSMAVNDFVCFFGYVSGPDYNCDTVYNTSVSMTTSAGTANRLVAVAGQPSIAGDSGGPWYYNNTAWGVQKGYTTINGAARATFSRAPLAVLDDPNPDSADQAAAGPGVLTLEQDCVFMVLDNGPVLLAWSSGLTEWSAESSAVRFTAIDGGTSVVQIGDTVTVGGGELSADPLWLRLPEACPDGEWFGVSSIRSISG